jgi:hypothetical protein
MFHIKSFLNFLDILNSSIRKPWTFFDIVSVRPLIFTPFIELSIVVVAAIRFSIASSHIA